tara:strand:- start:150 stop:275 length:126 start_codon:yes stop_codon:yes gene_type:complete
MTDLEQKQRKQRKQSDRNFILGLGFISIGLFILFIIIILKD